jgi:hypothetical protein
MTLQIIGDLLQYNRVEMIQFWVSRWLNSDTTSAYSFFASNGYELSPLGSGISFFARYTEPVYIAKGNSGTLCWFATRSDAADALAVFIINRGQSRRTVDIPIPSTMPAGEIECVCLEAENSNPHARAASITVRQLSAKLPGDTLRVRISPASAQIVRIGNF